MDRDALGAAITVALGAAASFVVAFVAVLFTRLFTDDPETEIVVGILAWALAFGGFLGAYVLRELS